jgi:hypothetical protein
MSLRLEKYPSEQSAIRSTLNRWIDSAFMDGGGGGGGGGTGRTESLGDQASVRVKTP